MPSYAHLRLHWAFFHTQREESGGKKQVKDSTAHKSSLFQDLSHMTYKEDPYKGID